LPQFLRPTFPYDNIEVITENSNLFLQTNYDLHNQDVQTSFFLADQFYNNANTWSYVTVLSSMFVISLTNNPGNAQIHYYLFDPNSIPVGNPIKTGILKVTWNNNATTPSMTDSGTSFQRFDETVTDPNVAYGSIQFRGLIYDNALTFQYMNNTPLTPTMYFRIERANGFSTG